MTVTIHPLTPFLMGLFYWSISTVWWIWEAFQQVFFPGSKVMWPDAFWLLTKSAFRNLHLAQNWKNSWLKLNLILNLKLTWTGQKHLIVHQWRFKVLIVSLHSKKNKQKKTTPFFCCSLTQLLAGMRRRCSHCTPYFMCHCQSVLPCQSSTSSF